MNYDILIIHVLISEHRDIQGHPRMLILTPAQNSYHFGSSIFKKHFNTVTATLLTPRNKLEAEMFLYTLFELFYS